MRALQKTQKGVGFIEVRDVPKPTPAAGEVLIKIELCGICGSDIHVRHDEFPYWPPVTLGHEFTGTVVEVGEGCKKLELGDRVVAEPHTLACGTCPLCRTGNIQICPDKRSPGWGIDGGMAEFIAYPEKLLHVIPDSMSWEQAVVIEPVANIVTDLLERTRVEAGDTVVVLGPGPIGLIAAMGARAVGAKQVILIGTPGDSNLRFPMAKELGFKHCVNIAETDAVQYVLDHTGGIGADVVVECSGSPRAIPTIPDLARKQGRVCIIGLTGRKMVELDWDKFAFKVLSLDFNMSTYYTSWEKSISLVASGKIQAEKLVTHKGKLEEWESVFDAVENLEALKGVLHP